MKTNAMFHNPTQVQAKAAAEQDASSAINKLLWFGVGVGIFFIGGVVGGLAGGAAGSIIAPGETSFFGYLPGITQLFAAFVGVTAGVVVPFNRIYNYKPDPPPERLAGKPPEYVSFYIDAYRGKARSLRTKWAIAGAVSGCGLSIIISPLLYLGLILQ